MSIIHRAGLGIASLALASGIAILPATAASAAPAYCPQTYACIWGDTGYFTKGNTAANIKFQRYIPDLSGWNYTGSKVNGGRTASSVWNNGKKKAAFFYKGKEKKGAAFRVAPGQGDPNLHDGVGIEAGFHDQIQSAYFHSFN